MLVYVRDLGLPPTHTLTRSQIDVILVHYEKGLGGNKPQISLHFLAFLSKSFLLYLLFSLPHKV